MDDVPLVGREEELRVGEALLDAAAAGAGAILVIEGEAGIGKSRLATELATRARRRGFRVLTGAADELGADDPFGPWMEALGDTSPGALSTAGFADPAGSAPSSPAGDLGFAVVQSITATIEELAADAPLLVVLDDLQWADPSSLRTVVALSRLVPGVAVLLALTVRTFPRTPALEATLDTLVERGARALPLAALDADDAVALAAAAGPHVGPHAGRVGTVGAAGGNPLLIIELARSAPMADDAALPGTLRAAVRRRLRSLPEATVEVLKVASVLGRRFPVDHLAAVTGRRAAELAQLLDDALAAGVLGAEGGELVFRHDLIRDAIYGELAVPLRRGLHRDAARVLATRRYPPVLVAEHLVAGAGPGDAEAVAWLRDAAAATAPRSPPIAVRLLEHALDLADPSSSQSDELAADLAPLLVQVGRAADAAALSRRVLARAPTPAVEAVLRRGLGEVLWTRGWLEPAVAELEAAGAVAGAPGDVRSDADALAAYLRCFLGEPAAAAGGTHGADGTGGGAGTDFAACARFQARAVSAAACGRAGEAVELAEKAVAAVARSRDPRAGILHPHLTLGFALLDVDRFDEAERVLQDGRDRAEARGAVAWLPLYHCVLAMKRLLGGDWDDALADVEAGTALAEELSTRLYSPLLLGMSAWVAIQRDELDLARLKMEQAVSEFLVATTPAWQADAAQGIAAAAARWPLEWGLWVSALLDEARGDDARAFAALRDAWAAARPLRYFLGYRLFAPDLVRASVRAGDRALAAAVVAEVDEGARRSGVPGAAATARRCRGLLDGDADGLAAAADALAASPRKTEAAFTSEEAGGALARAGRRAEAVDRLEEARRHYEVNGGTRALSRVDAALRALGVRRQRAGPGAATPGWASLSPTQLRVARLAAAGLTNRQIGERLFISPRTVETHLGHAFAKLGVATRAQLAAEAARHA